MANIIQQLEQSRITRKVPGFRPGDTVVVQVKVKEGDRERVQVKLTGGGRAAALDALEETERGGLDRQPAQCLAADEHHGLADRAQLWIHGMQFEVLDGPAPPPGRPARVWL